MSTDNGQFVRTVKKIKYLKKKKPTRNNLRAKLRKETQQEE